MPPKSGANRSGKSTPTRGGKATPTKNDKKEDENPIDPEEEERLRKEQEEKERLEREEKERQELERIEAILNECRDKQLYETQQIISNISNYIESKKTDERTMSKWDRFMRCDGSPDPTVVKEINTYCNLCRDEENLNINYILKKTKDIIALISELNHILSTTPEDELPAEVIIQYRETILALQDLILYRYNIGTLEELKNATYEADAESGNFQKIIKGEFETIMLWANLNKNPRFKAFTFDKENFTFELPKPLTMADIAVRVLHTSYDHYSHQCSTFAIRKKQVVEETPPDEEEVTEPVDEGNENKETEDENIDAKSEKDEDVKSTITNEGRKSAASMASGSQKTEDKTESENNAEEQSHITEENIALDDEDLLDEDVIDLRQYSPLGGVYQVELVKLPPQPKTINGWTLRQVIDKPLTQVEYPSEAFAPKPSSRAQSANEKIEGAEPKPTEVTQPPIGLAISLPSNVMFSEEPQVAMWDPIDSHWKTSGLTDTNYDEDNRIVSFKSLHFGTFSLLQDAHLNMPFQSWELKPIKQNHALLTVAAAITEVEIEIKNSECCLLAPVEEELMELSHLYGKWMTPEELIQAMKRAGINIFPDDDSHKFVSINEKEVNLDRIYEEMSILSTSFAFAWSRWNSTCPKDKIVMQIAPWMGIQSARPGSTKEETPAVYHAPPPNLVEDDWSLYVVGDDRCHKLKAEEYDDEFSMKLPPDIDMHVDMYHAFTLTPFKTKTPPPHCNINPYATAELCEHRVRNMDKDFAYTVRTLIRAAKFISFS